jgi:tripartite-type tricarboxylate transporter receptor subunit TctC
VKIPRRRFLHLVARSAAILPLPHIARAQVYPTRPITMIVPAAAGGPTDAIGRIMAEHMGRSLGQTIVIENVSGAGGSIGVGRVARATPDGYTIGLGHWGHYVVNGAIYRLQYDLRKDFEPVSLVATGPLVMAAKKSIPANDLKELVSWLKANSSKASAGTGGVGTPAHIGAVFFQKITGTQFTLVPYRGTGPAMLGLVAGDIDLMLDQASNILPNARSALIKAYAVTASSRLTAAPEIPTVDEAGVPGFYVSVWHAFWGPKRTPKAVTIKLNAAVVDALADPTVRRQLAELGQEIPQREQQTPETLGTFHMAEIEKWWPIIKAANIKGE